MTADTSTSADSKSPPVKKIIITQEHLATFLSSPTHDDIINFIQSLNDATIGVKLRDPIEDSPSVKALCYILDGVESIAKDTPTEENPNSRFGNPAFKSFYDKVKKETPSLLAKIPSLPSKQIPTLSVYFYESWGNRTRIDYGSGMELNFLCFLLVLYKLKAVTDNDFRALSVHVFWRYMEVMRVLQSKYWLEPAGSHGVWGLDDYHFLPFVFGSAQLCGHKHLKPKSIHSSDHIEEFSPDYMYFACIQFINSLKTASLPWHSPMLNDISGVRSWEKINSGLIKMYRGEVLSKLPVVQHFLFSPLLPFPGVERYDDDNESEQQQEQQQKNGGGFDLDTGTREHPHPVPVNHHGHVHRSDIEGPPECCGIPVPSAFAAAKARKESTLRTVVAPGSARRIPFD